MRDAPQSAWDFAVAVYGRPGARDACLALQDRRGADVVALLVLLHLAVLGQGAVAKDRLATALAMVASWRAQAVLPLRRIRRALKDWRFSGDTPDPGAESIRAAVAEAERAAERVQLDRLAAALAAGDAAQARDPDLTVSDGAMLLARYFRVAGLVTDEEDRAHLATLLAAAFPGAATDAREPVDRAFGA